MSMRDNIVGQIENEARNANEVLSVEGEKAELSGHESLAVLCECGDRNCHQPLSMSVDEYEVIRSDPAHFAVIPGHEILECERVVAQHHLYLVVEKFGEAGRVAGADDPRHNLRPCRVVIVDDIPEVRYLLKMLLAIEPSCVVVGEAGDGVSAVEVIEQCQPEVVVLDLEMPVLNGWQALPQIRSVSPSTHVIVFSSSDIEPRLEKRLSNLGAARFVHKGGDPSIIMDAIRDVALAGRDRRFSERWG